MNGHMCPELDSGFVCTWKLDEKTQCLGWRCRRAGRMKALGKNQGSRSGAFGLVILLTMCTVKQNYPWVVSLGETVTVSCLRNALMQRASFIPKFFKRR